MYSLIVTAKMNDIDPQAWLADVLARIAEHPASRLDELLPWNWRPKALPSTAPPENATPAVLTGCLQTLSNCLRGLPYGTVGKVGVALCRLLARMAEHAAN